MIRRAGWIAGLALAGAAGGALAVSLVSAQEAPESLLPPGFDDPAPTPTNTLVPPYWRLKSSYEADGA